MSNNINTALIEIEKNLHDLSSAREQVLEVTDSGKALAAVVIELTQKMETLYAAVLKESGSYDNAFEKGRKNFEEKLKVMIDHTHKDLTKFRENLNSVEPEIAERITQISERTLQETDTLLKKQEESFKSTLKKLNEYEKTMFNFSSYLSEFQFETKILSPLSHKVDSSEKTIVSVVKVFKTEAVRQMDQILADLKIRTDKLEVLVNNQQAEIVEAQKLELVNVQKEVKEGFDQLKLNQKKNTYITWGLIVVSLIILIFLK